MEKIELSNIIADILAGYFSDPIEIIKHDVSVLTGPGEHYGSVILKLDSDVKIHNTVKTLNLVAKKIPVNELLRIAFDVQVTFKKESFAYTVTIPTLLEFQKEFNFPNEKILNCFPKCYGARFNLLGKNEIVDENAVILFENLKSQGYETLDRLVGFDLEGTKLVMNDLAIFHGVPLALKILRPEIFEKKVMPGLVQHKGAEQLGQEVVDVFHNAIMDTVKQCPELEPYFDRIQKLVDYYETHPYVLRPEPSKEYGTMTHCDLWTSNLMVLKDAKGVIIKDKFVDMQLTNFSSPIRDLVFFLFTSVQNDVLKENLNFFIKLYHEKLLDILKYFPIDLEPYSWENFNIELENVAPKEVYHILFMLKIIYSQKGKVTNTTDKFQISDWTRKDLLGEDHRRKMRDTVLALISKNWI